MRSALQALQTLAAGDVRTMASTVSNVSSFLRRNIVVVLAVPPVVAAAFGVYAKLIRQPRQTSTAFTTEHAPAPQTDESYS